MLTNNTNFLKLNSIALLRDSECRQSDDKRVYGNRKNTYEKDY